MAGRVAVIVGTTEGIGDFLLRLPMVNAIRRVHPDKELWWLASYDTVVSGALRKYTGHLVHRVVENLRLYESPLRYISRLRALPHFDMVFDTRTRILDVAVSRSVMRAGEYYCALPGQILSSRRPKNAGRRPIGAGVRASRMARAAFGENVDLSGGLPVSDEAHLLAAHDLPDGPAYVGLMPGSNQTRKNWPLERFAAVARDLAAVGAAPVFILGPVERPWLETLRSLAPEALFPDLQSLDRTLALMPRLTAALANDSGMGHLAASLGVPLVSLFGPTHPDRCGPVGDAVKIIRAQAFGGETIDAIPVEPVIAAMRNLLPLV